MKKVLFATTALVATAGVASAEVALTGFAEMGITGGDNAFGDTYSSGATNPPVDDVNTNLHTDIGVTFTLSGETDGGLAFGGVHVSDDDVH